MYNSKYLLILQFFFHNFIVSLDPSPFSSNKYMDVASGELSKKELRLLLERRSEELHALRASYLEELRMLRGQLWNVKQKKKDGNTTLTPAIRFQLESDLELRLSVMPTTLPPTTANAAPQIKQLKRLVTKALSDQSCKTKIILETFNTKICTLTSRKEMLERQLKVLETTGKPELNRQIKKLRMRGLRLSAEAERKMSALRTAVKTSQAAANEAERNAVAMKMNTKEGVRIIFEQAMLNVNRHEMIMEKAILELDQRLEECTDRFSRSCRIMNMKFVQRESKLREIAKKEEAARIHEDALEASMETRKYLEQMKVQKNTTIVRTEKVKETEWKEQGMAEMEKKEKEKEEQAVFKEAQEPGEEVLEQVLKETEEANPVAAVDEEYASISPSSSLQDMEEYLEEFEIQQRREEDVNVKGTCTIDRSMSMSGKTFPSPPSRTRKRIISPRNRSTSVLSASPSMSFGRSNTKKCSKETPKASFLGFYPCQ